jgi:hypothetical protein
MARVYSAQFEIAQDATLGKDLTPDEGTLWIIRQVLVYSGNSATDGLSWALVESVTHAQPLTLQFPDAHTGVEFFTGRLVIPFGQTWNAECSAFLGDAGCDWYIGGYVLELP